MLIRKLWRTGLLTPRGLFRMAQALATSGANVMALLRLAARRYPDRTAVIDEQERLTYAELWRQAESSALALHAEHGVRSRQKAAIACRNHAAAIKAIFALSRLGAHVFLVNPEMSADQLLSLDRHLGFDFYVYDEPHAAVFAGPLAGRKSLPAYHPTGDSIDRLGSRPAPAGERLKKAPAGNIVIMTGGTTGRPKAASRRPSVFTFLPPLFALLTQVHIDEYRSVYVATPIYHGFGLSALFIGVLLGLEMHFTRRFEAGRACALIAERRIEAVTLVPLMLQRMLGADPGALASLRCVISGGAALSPALARDALARLGPVLFNLYGTSEAGLAIMGTPDLLSRKPESIGRPFRGVRARIADESGGEVSGASVGRLWVRSAWTTSRRNWIETGDLAYRDSEGDIFLCGRTDDMIVSGGENVYPVDLENVLLRHPDVDSAAVVGIADAEFGQRLKAVVVRKRGAGLDQAALLEWLKPRVARYQMPAVIEFREELPYTAVGKLDKRALQQ